MRLHPAAAVIATIVLAACDRGGTTSGNASGGMFPTSNRAARDPAPAPAPAAPTAPSGLAAEMSLAVEQMRPQLPIVVDNMTTLTGVRAEGTEFVYEMTLTQQLPVGAEQARQAMQTSNQRNICSNPQTSALINRGASMRHVYNGGGASFETRVTSCS